MASLLNASGISKRYGADPLFTAISFDVAEGERIGLVGPNGSGKSTLIEILGGRVEPDSGTVALRRNLRLGYVRQVSDFAADLTVSEVIAHACAALNVPESDRPGVIAETLGRAGFTNFDAEAQRLSGGWRKRLAIAEALVAKPDLLLLDEPTNHLDLAGIEWLEKVILNERFSCVVVSHDRYFLENVVTDMAELNRIYPNGMFRVKSSYSGFLEKKSEFMAAQAKRQEALENRVRTEVEWLRRGPKARATKAKARIDKANELIGELRDLSARTATSRSGIDFTATDRKTKRLIEVDSAAYDLPQRRLFQNLSLVLPAGTRVGLVGPNGSGKTTLLRLLRGELQPSEGEIRRADNLRIVYFDQNRPLDESVTLRRALAPDSDSVNYNGQTIHVASWAARFLFTSEQLNQSVSRLSGGERARVLIARLMLEPADVLLLDEPTNDLDISTLEILEESLLEFRGVLVMVTHDRYMLDRVSSVVWGLNGEGGAELFADYSQWETWLETRAPERAGEKENRTGSNAGAGKTAAASSSPQKKKLSYLDSRDFETIESRIDDAESELAAQQTQLTDLAVTSDPKRLQVVLDAVSVAQSKVDELYERWAELEAKTG